jgi:hypothetical protein
MRPDGKEILELAHLVDADLAARSVRFALSWLALRLAGLGERLRLEDPEVGMAPLSEPQARRARSAREIGIRRALAQESLGEEFREDGLSEAWTPVDEERVRQVAPPPLKLLPSLT